MLGLRASEALDYEVLFADTAKFSAGQIQSAYKNIEQGDIQNVFRPLMEGKKYEPCWTYVSNGHHYDLEKNPLIVKIYTRKRTHLTNAGLKTERYLVLKNIAFSDLESIYWTSQWKHVFFPDFMGQRSEAQMTVIVKKKSFSSSSGVD